MNRDGKNVKDIQIRKRRQYETTKMTIWSFAAFFLLDSSSSSSSSFSSFFSFMVFHRYFSCFSRVVAPPHLTPAPPPPLPPAPPPHPPPAPPPHFLRHFLGFCDLRKKDGDVNHRSIVLNGQQYPVIQYSFYFIYWVIYMVG